MQAEGIRKGDRLDVYDQFGKVCDGWTAAENARLSGSRVTLNVTYHDGEQSTLEWEKGHQVPITFGVG